MVIRSKYALDSRYYNRSFSIKNSPTRPFSFKRDKDLFSKMWMLGYTVPQIMDLFSIKDAQTVKNWRHRLGLPKRKQGNYRTVPRQIQVEYMKSQIKE